ncbi:site-specific integrase [Spirosoma harenae]
MARTTGHKEGKATVTIIYRTAKTLADGSHPFWVRITKDRKSKFVATGLSLHPQYWNAEKGKIRSSYPTERRKFLEAAFRTWQERYEDAAENYASGDQPHNAADIADKVSDERRTTRQFKLLAYFDELISQFEKTGNVGNRKVYRDVQNNLSRYIGEGKDVSFDHVTVKFCNGWETKMRSEGLTEITLSVKFRTLRAVLNKAIANGYAKFEHYPFARITAETHKYQVGKFDTKTTKRAISKADIRKIESYEPEPYTGPYASLRDHSARLLLARDLFLFSYYCGGINFVDMAGLQWRNIGTDLDDKPRLTYTRQKTGGRFSIRLIPQALTILERYRVGEKPYPTEYVFPILHSALHKTPTQKHNRASKIMGQVNKDLKSIGTATGIETPLTTYVARHSFATSLKRSGVATGIISEAMGHSDERTTQIYLSGFDTDLVDAAFDNL